jgi:hypothetical protein
MTFLRAVSEENGTTEARAITNPPMTTATASVIARHGCWTRRATLDCISVIGLFQLSRELDPSKRVYEGLRAVAFGVNRLLASEQLRQVAQFS